MGNDKVYINYYQHCGIEWEETADCMCNDRCPICNKEIEPGDSEEPQESILIVAQAETEK